VKASGAQLQTAGPEHFVRIGPRNVLALLDAGEHLPGADEQVRAVLREARIDAPNDLMPSVETFLHAACLELDGVNFVGHTHPTAINALTCSRSFEEALSGRLFPDEIVMCGAAPLLVPYVDPGLALARELRRRLRAYIDEQGAPPKSIYLQNHGFIALGATTEQVEGITAMAVKAARIRAGTFASGGPNPLPAEQVRRIDGRSDEAYRQRILKQR
jgi:rhamnose utilization protein RhaD (predicted bifunctional aldolase and dehydrogenase)